MERLKTSASPMKEQPSDSESALKALLMLLVSPVPIAWGLYLIWMVSRGYTYSHWGVSRYPFQVLAEGLLAIIVGLYLIWAGWKKLKRS